MTKPEGISGKLLKRLILDSVSSDALSSDGLRLKDAIETSAAKSEADKDPTDNGAHAYKLRKQLLGRYTPHRATTLKKLERAIRIGKGKRKTSYRDDILKKRERTIQAKEAIRTAKGLEPLEVNMAKIRPNFWFDLWLHGKKHGAI